jgi:hypothetical protein
MAMVTHAFNKAFYMEYEGDEMVSIETTEDISTSSITYTLRKGDTLHRTRMFLNYETDSWYYMDYEKDIEIHANRDGNEIEISGRVGTRNITEILTVNFDPWYQLIEPAIHHFVTSKKVEQSFWVINPDTLTTHHMIVSGKEYTTVQIEDRPVPAVQVTVTFSNSMSVMWQATYWYGTRNAKFLHYETVSQSPLVKSVKIVPLR